MTTGPRAVAARLDGTHVALLRLVAQGIVGPRRASHDAVARLLCLQAQDYRSGVLSLVVRGAPDLASVEASFDGGTVVRAWPLRGTLHLVRSSDLGWLRELLSGRELAAARGRAARLDITEDVLDRAARQATELLSDVGACSRAELMAAWEGAGVETGGQRGYHLVWHLAHRGLLCFGPVRDHQQLLVLAPEWTGPSASLSREEGLERLARQYFEGHGPAQPSDLARWANLSAADVKEAVALVRPRLAALDLDGQEYLLDPSMGDQLSERRQEAEGVVVLPPFDELLFGYRDRRVTLPEDRSAQVFPRANGVPTGTVVLKGRVVATWSRSARGSPAPVDVVPLVAVPARALRAAEHQAAALVAQR
jgi:hypothetical protein